MADEPERVGLFIDGHFFQITYDHLKNVYSEDSRMSIQGLHESLEYVLSSEKTARIVESHFFAGRYSTSAFDIALEEWGVSVHTLPVYNGKEKGIDVLFALTVYSRALEADLDTVVLVCGDGDFIPLARMLQESGVDVVVPFLEGPCHDDTTVGVAAGLWEHAEGVMWDDVVRASAGHEHMIPLFVRDVARDEDIKDHPQRRFGIITRWVHTYGFITDVVGASWYFHITGLNNDEKPRVGNRVLFSGAPHPTPGQKYPTAYTVEIDDRVHPMFRGFHGE